MGMGGRVLTSTDAGRTPDATVNGPRLSIVVVNWNTRDLLLALLGRLLAAGGAPPDAEVVVVDNDSADGSADAASAAFPGAVVVRSGRNGGFAFGVNRGIATARGDWILLLNTDTEVAPGAIARFVDDAGAHRDGGVFGPRITDERGAPQPSSWPDHGVLRPLPDALGLARWLDRARWFGRRTAPAAGPVDCVSGCVFLIRRQALAAAGAMDERF